jgi:aminoglycoside/choline kinase family phosphotransferase
MTPERREEMHDFLRAAGWAEAAISPLPDDASTRHYLRLHQDGKNAMLMDQPQEAETPQCPAGATPEQRKTLGYNAVARLAGADCGRFVAAADFLRGKGVSAPAIYAADVKHGFVLIEDLGDGLFANVLADSDGDEHALYAAAIDALALLHVEPAPTNLSPDKPLFAYDETALLAETDLMAEWFIPVALGRGATPEERDEHRSLWRDVLRPILASRSVFVHRDYHAQNLFWLPGREGAARVGMIDFQDAVAGSASYDLISLLEDARRDVSPELAGAMIRRYMDDIRNSGAAVDEDAFRAEAAIMAAQRNAKIAGIFARLYKRDGKPRYLSYLPRVWRYLDCDLEHPAVQPLQAWYDRKIPAEARHELRVGEAA